MRQDVLATAAKGTPVQRLGVLFARLAQPYQPSPNPLSGRPAHRPFRGLLGVHSRCGLHTRTVTEFVTVIRRLQTFRHLHACSGCFRLERLPGGACTRWRSAALSRRTWRADLCAYEFNCHERLFAITSIFIASVNAARATATGNRITPELGHPFGKDVPNEFGAQPQIIWSRRKTSPMASG